MKVLSAMTTDPRSVTPDSTIQEVAQTMKDEAVGFIPVCDEGQLVGVITDRDIVLRCLADGHPAPLQELVSHCMTADVVTIDEDAELAEAASLMSQREIRRLPVVKGGKLVGVLSHGNVVQATGSQGPGDAATLGVTRGA